MTLAAAEPQAREGNEKLVEWSDDLSVGIQEIDEQHKLLVSLLNRLHTAIVEHHGSDVAQDILRQLTEYTKIHFAVEESLMRILGFPDYAEHKRHHEMLIAEVRELSAKLEQEKKSISFELLHFLKMWLTKHIMEEDQAYSPHFLSKGVIASYEQENRSWMHRLWDSLH